MNETIKKSDFYNKTPLNIAFFLDWFEREYQISIMRGMVDTARRLGVNLYCLEGGCLLKKDAEFDRNLLFELVKGHNVDGLIISSAPIGHYASTEAMTQFCRRYAPLPIVSIAKEIEGCSSILVDNSALQDVITHLVKVHHHQKFALINGPQNNRDTKFRLEIFRQALAEHRIAVNPDLIVDGGFFGGKTGANEVKILLDERKETFDVIIAFNDTMALGVLNELQARGIKVPDQVAVIGFDNIKSSACCNPPLTTIDCFLYEQGKQSLELITDIIINKTGPRQLYIPSRLVLRESCGCLSQTAPQCTIAGLSPEIKRTDFIFSKYKEQIRRNIIDKLPVLFPYRTDINFQTVDMLLNAFQLQMRSEADTPLLKAFRKIMDNRQMPYEDISIWHNLLTLFFQEISPYINDPPCPQISVAFHQVRLMIAEKANIQERNNYHEALNHHYILNELSRDLLSILSISQAMKVFSEKLPQLGINTCCISEYETCNHEYRILMAYNRQGSIDFGETVFSGCFIPEEILDANEPHIFLITMIYCSKKRFCTIAVEFEHSFADIFAVLKGMLTSSLSGVIQMRELHHQEKQLLSQQQHLLDELRKAMEGFVWTIQLMMEVRDPYTAGHQSRVSDLACAIAREMNLPAEFIEGLWMAGIIHDLGKIAIPIEILNKPGRLKPTELALIKEHPAIAYEILKNIDFPWPIAQIVVQHHERLDGSGYPEGLYDVDILVEAKILAVADVIEAMASHRPYRPALGVDMALEEIKTNRGKLYDNHVVDTCLELFFIKGYQLK
jgi:HD-GYP domain-containing protein (c-di-GMP phosphodiesterase class II)/DNA-binding LacI/PurR family transcriptional regulator